MTLPLTEHTRACAIVALETQDRIDALRRYWLDLNRHQPAIARDPRVIEAKDTRKAELMKKEAE